MKTRTRIVAWVYMIFLAYIFLTTMHMFIKSHAYTRLSLYTIIQTFLWSMQWPFWIFILKKQAWAWYALITVYALLIVQWFNMLISGATHDISSLASLMLLIWYLAFALVITIIPIWILLTDRPNMWKTNVDETASLEKVAE